MYRRACLWIEEGQQCRWRHEGTMWVVLPLGLMLLKDLALGVVANDFDIGEAAQIQALCTELSHCNLKRGGRLRECNGIRDICSALASRTPSRSGYGGISSADRMWRACSLAAVNATRRDRTSNAGALSVRHFGIAGLPFSSIWHL